VAATNIIPFSSGRKTVVITGCGRGLGRALALGFAARGDRVAACVRTKRAVRDLERALGAPHLVVQADVRDEEALRGFAERVLGELGLPDLVVNNAGVINGAAPVWEVSAEEFAEVMAVNVGGTAAVLRQFLPPLIEAEHPAVVVNFSSTWGRTASPEVAPYVASKWAVEGLTRAVAEEVPPFLGVVAVNPGIIRTDMLVACLGAAAAAGYPGPEEWARAAVPFLANLRPEDNGKALTCP
jgi:NAD(P)-dependent dehydrogenase (short-subunit alcohol dehydrogenase family)